jgi:hypothetical protein
MTLTYSIPLETVTFEWTVAEQEEMTADTITKLQQQFEALITWVKSQSAIGK